MKATKAISRLFYYNGLLLLTNFYCVNVIALAESSHNVLSFLRFSDAFKITKSRTWRADISKDYTRIRPQMQQRPSLPTTLATHDIGDNIDGDYDSGYFKYETFYSGCVGERQTTYLALGECMLDNDGSYSKLTGSLSEDGTTTTVNQYFYIDSICNISMEIYNSFTLDAECSTSTEYSTGFSSKISKPNGKNIELE